MCARSSRTYRYDNICHKLGFTPFAGSNAKFGQRAQPAEIGDVLLHETAISWIKERIKTSNALVKTPWNETPQEFARRLDLIMKGLNSECNVKGLSLEFPARLSALCKGQGKRLPK